MLNLKSGHAIAYIKSGKYKGEIIYIDRPDFETGETLEKGCQKMDLKKGSLQPLLDTDERQVVFIAGPSGSGKTTVAVKLAKDFKKLHPKRDIYLFSRTKYEDDPAYAKLKPMQVMLDQTLVDQPVDIETEVRKGSLLIFDDIGTINDENVRKAVNSLAMDIMEVGRKMHLTIIITSHLINMSDRKFSRTVHNELQTFTFFPKSGSLYQIRYNLKNYWGLSNKQIDEIANLPSRWVTMIKSYPVTVMYEHGVYIL